MNDYAKQISDECDAIKAMLLAKNVAYGASAFEPLRIFSRADPVEQLNVRIARGSEFAGDDTELDLIGYLILRRVARTPSKPAEPPLVRIGQGDTQRDIQG